MAVNIKLKRSAVPGKIPTTTSLELGEIALNTYDGRAFMKQQQGVTETIIELATTAGSGSSVTSASYASTASYANYASNAGTAATATSASYATNSTSASYAVSTSYVATSSYANNAGSASYSDTASYANDFKVAGTLTAQTIHVQYVTSSQELVTGSLTVEGGITGSLSGTASNAVSSSYAETASVAPNYTTLTSFNNFTQSYYVDSASFDARISGESASFVALSSSYLASSASFDTRILNNSASISLLSSSYLASSASFDTRIINNSSSISFLSSSYLNSSASFDTRITSNSASISALSSSYLASSASFDTRITNNSASIALLSGSYLADSSSFNVRINNNSSSIAFLSSSYLASSASFDTRITNNSASISSLSSSFLAFSASYNTGSFNGNFNGSFTGSFSGSLANLQGSPTYIPFFSSSQLLANSSMYQIGTASIAINETNVNITNPEALYVFQTNPTSINVISGKGNLNNYLQLNIQNTNQGANASSDIVATANNGTETDKYIDMGINSENYSANFVGGPNDTYVYGAGNDFHIGNITPNHHLGFFVGGNDTEANKKLQLNTNNYHLMSGSLDVSGSVIAKAFTGSLFGTSSWAVSSSQALNSILLNGTSSGVFATTGSNIFKGSQTINGNLFMSGSFPLVYNNDSTNNMLFGMFDGSAIYGPYYQLFGNQYPNLSQRGGAEFIYDIRNNPDANFHISSFNGSSWTQKFLVNDSGVQVTGSLDVSNGITGSLLGTSSYALQALTSSNALTASSADDFLVRGTLTAQRIVAQIITSSVEFVTGSTKFGSLLSNTHQFTGSVSITGSLGINGVDYNATSASFESRILSNSSSVALLSSSYLASSASFDTRIINNSASISFLSSSYLASSASFDTRIINNSSSIAFLSSSYLASSASFDIRITNNSASISTLSSSYLASSASFDTRITNNSTSVATLSSSYLASSASFDTRIINNSSSVAALSSSFLAFSTSYNTGSFTGSFRGILTGTASYAQNADLLDGKDSSVFATTGSNIFVGNQTITGSLNVSGSTIQIGNNNLFGNTTLSGSIIISGSLGTQPTVRIYGDTTHNGYIRFDPVSTNINQSLSASYIYVSGSTNDLYFTQNGNGYNNTTRLRWLEGNLYTGLLNGGLITITTGSTTFNLSSGSGIVVNLNASLTDNPYPTITYVNWGNFTNVPITFLTSSIQSYIGIDSNGQITQQNTPFTDGEYNTKILIGSVLHQNKTTVNASITYPNVAYGYKQRTYDFIKAFGPLKLSGYTITPSGSLGLTVGSGTAWADGRNYQVDPNNPSYITDPGTSVSKIFRYYQSGSSFIQDTNGGLGYTVIDPANYNNNGTLTAISPSTPFTIQRVFWYPNSATKGIVVYYGNAQYSSIAEAAANINYETFNEVENTKQNAVYLGAIIIKYNGTFASTADYSILPGGIFRSVGGAGGGGSVVTARLVDLADVAISGPTDGQPLAYDGVNLKWKNLSYISASISGNAVTATSASYAATSSLALTASSADNFTVRGTLTAQTINVQTVTSSVVYASGSNIFGNNLGNTHQFTGSVTVTGSLGVNGSQVILTNQTASMTVLSSSYAATASYVLNAVSASYSQIAVSSSYALNASNAISASYALNADNAATASYVLNAVSASFATSASLAATANNAKAIDIYVFGSNVDSYLLMSNVAGTTGVAIGGDADLRYNASTNTLTVGNINATSLTGSLLGTASFANNATTASYALQSLSSSFASTASFVPNAFVQNGNSFGTTATIGTNDNQDVVIETNNTEAIRITNGQRVGINTTNPGTRTLDINGQVRIKSVAGKPADLTIISHADPDAGGNQAYVVHTTTGSLSNSAALIQGYYGAGVAGSTSLLLNPQGGRVGINTGTNLPSSASLQIDGNVWAYSYTGSLQGTASFALTASYAANVPVTASYALQSLSASYAATASSADNFLVRGNLTAGDSSGDTHTVTGSFDILGRTSVTVPSGEAFVTTADTLIFTGSTFISGNVVVTGSVNAPSFTGSLFGTSSWALNAVTASYALNAGAGAGFPYSGSAVITGSLLVTQGITGSLLGTASFALNVADNGYVHTQSSPTASWLINHPLQTLVPLVQVYDISYNQVIPSTITIVNNSTVRVTFSSAQTGYAIISKGSGVSSTSAISSSYALTASYAQTSDTSSFALTASYAPLAVSASYAVTSSYGIASTNIGYGIGISSIYTSTINSSVVGSNNLFTTPTGSFASAFYKYVARSGSNARSGEIMAVWNSAGSVQFTDYSTLDLGSTTAVTASVTIVTGQAQLNFQTNTSGWNIKSQATYL